MLNKEFIKRKINLIEEELVHLAEFSQYSFSEIASDYKKQAIIERLLERIIMRAIDINQHIISELASKNTVTPKDYKETFLGLVEFNIYPKEFSDEIFKSVGTRNVLVHEYDKIDHNRIYLSMKDCLRDYLDIASIFWIFWRKIKINFFKKIWPIKKNPCLCIYPS